MRIDKLFVNPEVKKVTLKYLAVLLTGIVVMYCISYKLSNDIKEKIINQNIATYAYVLEGKESSEFAELFTSNPNEQAISEAKEILNKYGYSSDMTFAANEIDKSIFIKILIFTVSCIVMFITILYLLFVNELKKMYLGIEAIIENTGAMSDGEYKPLNDEEKEGDMAKLVSSLNYMGDRVNNSIELLRSDKEKLKDFLSDISHQLKTPLASLVMFNDLMLENEDMPYEDRINFLKSSEEQLRRMEWLIMNLLKVGRLEADAIKFNIYKQPLRETLESAVAPLLESAKNKNQNIIINGDLDTEINHDREWLSEAVSNIVKNAVEHTASGGKIEVSVSKGPLITKIYIKDNGPGISKEMQKKVFQRFYKGENSSNPMSIGIGLSLAKSIIEEQNGEIRLKSEEGKGTTFIINFFEE